MEQFMAEYGVEVPPDLSSLFTRPPEDGGGELGEWPRGEG